VRAPGVVAVALGLAAPALAADDVVAFVVAASKPGAT
jgi:hypothetical protein